MLRYEDLCFDPYGTVDRLIKAFNYRPIHGLINKYVTEHTGQTRSGQYINVSQAVHDNPSSSVKNSKIKPFEWKTKISSTLLQAVQDQCEKPMNELGYAKWNPWNGEDENNQILIKNAIEGWPFL